MIGIMDLRIGNFVKHPYSALMFKVMEISHTSVSIGVGELIDDVLTSEELLPIPLTPEILEKCGFKKMNYAWDIGETDLERISLFDFNYCKGDLNLLLNVSGCPSPKIEYLHQLQNLVYALTNEELKIIL